MVGLSLYECDRRRRIPVRSLVQPITAELQQQAAKVRVSPLLVVCAEFSISPLKTRKQI